MENHFQELLKEIKRLAKKIKKEVRLMEVCGTLTQTSVSFGIRNLMPKNIKLITGPGCPVCITPQEEIDAVVNLALKGVPIATYGDVLRVPGFYGSLEEARGQGAWVREVYSAEEALFLQKKKPDLIFFGIGFETTAPMTALSVKKGLNVYSAHRLFFPALAALLKVPGLKIDGFLCPGHVSAIIGSEIYKRLKFPSVVSGFEPEDLLISIYLLLKQIFEKRREAENEYWRSVEPKGNFAAYKAIFDVFEVKDAQWRGLGKIARSGLELKRKYAAQDAKVKYKNILKGIDFSKSKLDKACSCAEVLLGKKEPKDCPLFQRVCSPRSPKGPCMVSVEGPCYIEFNYS
ncbi:MAG TPA: hydrogenase formation protein HypD [Candidatus Parcubacteria bacterium]|nr:hydrogenase formation protein HypD [Candidatus Parcubacteria bacterium]